MSSNSIRVDAELFRIAREQGNLMSRSAAQQIEHWARIGSALEECDLTVAQVARLLQGQAEGEAAKAPGDFDLWAFKRERQSTDMANARSGRVTQAQLSWFSDGVARSVKLTNSPY